MSLILSREDYFPARNLPIAVAERMPQPSFPPHQHRFSEIVIVWRGNGLHILNDRPTADYLRRCVLYSRQRLP